MLAQCSILTNSTTVNIGKIHTFIILDVLPKIGRYVPRAIFCWHVCNRNAARCVHPMFFSMLFLLQLVILQTFFFFVLSRIMAKFGCLMLVWLGVFQLFPEILMTQKTFLEHHMLVWFDFTNLSWNLKKAENISWPSDVVFVGYFLTFFWNLNCTNNSSWRKSANCCGKLEELCGFLQGQRILVVRIQSCGWLQVVMS